MLKTTNLLILSSIIIFSLIGIVEIQESFVDSAYGLDCYPITFEEYFKKIPFIFSGRVISVDHSTKYSDERTESSIVTFQVLEIFKGNNTNSVSLVTHVHDTWGGIRYEEDSQYNVYATVSNNGLSADSICGLTTESNIKNTKMVREMAEKLCYVPFKPIQESITIEPMEVPMPDTFELDPDTLVGYNIQGGTIKDMKTNAEDNSFLVSINAISDGKLEIYISPEYLNTSNLYDANDVTQYSILIDGEKVDGNKYGFGNAPSRIQIDFEQGDSDILILDSMVEDSSDLVIGFFVLICGIVIMIIFIVWRKRKLDY